MTTRANILGFIAAALLFLAMFFGATNATTAPERECSQCGRWGHWWGDRCPHCGK